MLRYSIFLSLYFSLLVSINGQVVSYSPMYPTLSDSIEIIYDASMGNAELTGVSPVYMHTGTISENSLSNSDWKHRINPWPTGDPDLVIIDSLVLMQDLGSNLHRVKIKPNAYYGTNPIIDYNALAFVFRDLNGTLAGKNADNSDIFIPIFEPGYDAMFFEPKTSAHRVNAGDPIDIEILSNESSDITLYHDGSIVKQVFGNTILTDTLFAPSSGVHWLRLEATGTTGTKIDSIYYIVDEPTVLVDPPFATQNGINYVNDSTVILQFYGLGKSFAYVIGDFNDWKIDPAYRMNQTLDGSAFWIQISGLTPGTEYAYQYVIDQDVVIADPWAEKYLDEFNDINILPFTYPGLKDYPSGKTHGMVSIFQTAQTPYTWSTSSFSRPWSQDLVIYELLIRDFLLHHDYEKLTDTLDYLQNLGINAIELMPINEFDGNQSWGYAPAFYNAPDKYYGPKEDLQAFIDECHSRGIAVIVDVVFNHAFGQNSMARLYQDKNSGKPSWDNPWFNDHVPHPFGFYNDFDHSSLKTQYMVDRVLQHWHDEYKIDGFRFDLSKGFTNVYSYPSDIGLWSTYDSDRIYWLKRIYDVVRTYDSDCFMILEHFSDAAEELELSNHGFLLWGNANSQYRQAAMGYESGSDFSWHVSSKHRSWPFQHLIGYMESHDEERLMYECHEYGNMQINGAGDTIYNIQETATALKRVEMCAAFFYTVPGPKMLWQFGELGYDFSINFNGRTNPKPIRWNYFQEGNRHRLYKAFRALIKLKTENIAFRSSNYDLDVWGTGKRMWITDPSMNVTIIGNFGVDSLSTMMPSFQHTGQWFDYMTGDTIFVSNVNDPIPLAAGEYHVYTDVKLAEPDLNGPVSIEEEISEQNRFKIETFVYPNPFSEEVLINYTLKESGKTKITIYDILGNKVKEIVNNFQSSGNHSIKWNGTNDKGSIQSGGHFFYRIEQMNHYCSGQIVKVH